MAVKYIITLKKKLVTLYLDISTEICKNHENGCNTAKKKYLKMLKITVK